MVFDLYAPTTGALMELTNVGVSISGASQVSKNFKEPDDHADMRCALMLSSMS